MPREACTRPAKKVEVKASCRNSSGSAEGLTASRSIDPITSDAIDTGPTARSRELPSTAYTMGGTKLESAAHAKGMRTARSFLKITETKIIIQQVIILADEISC
jgi:hypothetical protein